MELVEAGGVGRVSVGSAGEFSGVTFGDGAVLGRGAYCGGWA